MNYEICKAVKENLDEVIELWRKLMEEHKDMDPVFFANINEERYKKDIMNCFLYPDEATMFVCIIEGKVIGYITAALLKRYQYYNNISYCIIDDIMVNSQYRNVGIGKSLIENVKNWAKQHNAERIELNIIHENKVEHDIFKKQGFQDSWHSLVLTL